MASRCSRAAASRCLCSMRSSSEMLLGRSMIAHLGECDYSRWEKWAGSRRPAQVTLLAVRIEAGAVVGGGAGVGLGAGEEREEGEEKSEEVAWHGGLLARLGC